MKYFNYEIHGNLKNAQIIHKNGFFVGNHQVDINQEIDLLKNVLFKI